MAAQQRRDDILQEELRGLRVSLEASAAQQLNMQPSPAGQSTRGGGSLRRELPTPAPHRAPPSATGQGEQLIHSPNRLDNDYIDQPAIQRKEPKMPAYQQGEDIENYLLRFESMARTWQWPKEESPCRLIPLLTGKALEAYTAMDEDRSKRYEDLREALLAKFDISAEMYRQRFRAHSTPAGETPTETYQRLKGLYRRWMRPEQRAPRALQDNHTRDNHRNRDDPPRNLEGNRGEQDKGHTAQTWTKTLVCYHCQQPGHKASVCPLKRPKMTGWCYVPRKNEQGDNHDSGEKSRTVQVKVNGKLHY